MVDNYVDCVNREEEKEKETIRGLLATCGQADGECADRQTE